MPLIRNFPFFCIMLSMICGISSAMLPGRIARKVTVVLAVVVAALNTVVLVHLMQAGELMRRRPEYRSRRSTGQSTL
jgi:hypothetical protein